jgi:hypothetical protein
MCLQAFPAHTGEVLALQASCSQASSFLVSGGTDFQVRTQRCWLAAAAAAAHLRLAFTICLNPFFDMHACPAQAQ